MRPTITITGFTLPLKNNHKAVPEIRTKTKDLIVSESNIAFLSAITASKKPGISLYCCASLKPSKVPNICASAKPKIIKAPNASIAFFNPWYFSSLFISAEKKAFKPKIPKIGTHNSAITWIDETALNLLYSGT